MSLKDIAVALDPTSEGDDRLHLAASLARRYEARLTGFYVVPDMHSCYSFVRGHRAIRSMIGSYSRSRQRDAVRNGRRFTCIARQHNVQADFRVIWRDADIGCPPLFTDILIIGNGTPPGLPNHWPPERLLFAESGVPLLIVPAGWRTAATTQRIVVAWNGSREARRATTDAIPFLAKARSVTLLMVGDMSDEVDVDIVLYLARHGVRAGIEHVVSDKRSVAKVILSEAVRHDADLVVIGAYGHARPLRMFFGGTTRAILRTATIPVLVSR